MHNTLSSNWANFLNYDEFMYFRFLQYRSVVFTVTCYHSSMKHTGYDFDERVRINKICPTNCVATKQNATIINGNRKLLKIWISYRNYSKIPVTYHFPYPFFYLSTFLRDPDKWRWQHSAFWEQEANFSKRLILI